MLFANETRASQLCDALNGVVLQLKHSECTEVLSKLAPGYVNNKQNSCSNIDQRRAEQFVDQLYEGMVEVNYTKFTQLFEEKFLFHIPEVDFKKNIREEHEKLGAYIGREFLGSVMGTKRPGDDRYPNLVRYLWRCFFEKNQVIITIGIYRNGGIYYMDECSYR